MQFILSTSKKGKHKRLFFVRSNQGRAVWSKDYRQAENFLLLSVAQRVKSLYETPSNRICVFVSTASGLFQVSNVALTMVDC